MNDKKSNVDYEMKYYKYKAKYLKAKSNQNMLVGGNVKLEQTFS